MVWSMGEEFQFLFGGRGTVLVPFRHRPPVNPECMCRVYVRESTAAGGGGGCPGIRVQAVMSASMRVLGTKQMFSV